MSPRLARRLIRLYPRPWRARYEAEFVALLEVCDLGWREVMDVGRGAAREWLRMTWIGRGLALGLEAWLTAVVYSLVAASIGSLITGVLRFLFGLEPTVTLPFLSLDLAKSFVVQMPAAMALAAALTTPWFVLTRASGHASRSPVTVRIISLVPVFAVSMVFGFSGEQLCGMVLAAWLVSEDIVGPKAKALAS
ncbi:MAG TPA: hypothetical protein VJN96_06145 [Vicinamibacterales bacterium]|nr:hypothetical protein [Vicinamibacterales bacterium]